MKEITIPKDVETIPEDVEESFIDMKGRLIHAELWFVDDDGIVSSCILTMDDNDHEYECTPCSSLGFALDHYALSCDDKLDGLEPVDSGTLAEIQAWADSNGY